MHDMAAQMYETEIRGLRSAADTRGNIIGAGGAVRSALLARNEQERSESMKRLQQRFASAYKSLVQLNTLFITVISEEHTSALHSLMLFSFSFFFFSLFFFFFFF